MFASVSEKLASLISRIKWHTTNLDVMFRVLYLGTMKISSEVGEC
jgi:hypothetical protein